MTQTLDFKAPHAATPDLSKMVGNRLVHVPVTVDVSQVRASIIRALTAGQGKQVRKLESSFGGEIIMVREDGLHRFAQKGLASRFCTSFFGWVKRLLSGGVQ